MRPHMMDPHVRHAYVVSALRAADPIELSDFVGCISLGDQPGIYLGDRGREPTSVKG